MRRRTASLTLRLALAAATTAAALTALPETARAEAPAQDAAMSADDAAKIVALFDDLVDTAAKLGRECPALATGIEGVVQRHRATVELSWAAQKAKRTLPKEAQARLDKRAVELVSALKPCWNDAAVKAAFAQMRPPKEPQK